mmetsp:Transcript_12395/g.20257  ORF Transcript_12395/g.20257 Transcript_12395/m.20257 type:complete len:348 (-) Transcript_12395:47-1090(-)|eukprot:CAMPEP_0169107588 /NCGR_PEP_ID=MMETSP1015-20121227/24966_1 /TAXON_ID=342587 /ORGANISM="Karlodinium micrum, Strain CCMP2283" /LENGTH=347 /DNA_ID=CAMNT_0009169137 /DNA_START=59 /DNA_END=1102 /DNA_ORIENTATION=-
MADAASLQRKLDDLQRQFDEQTRRQQDEVAALTKSVVDLQALTVSYEEASKKNVVVSGGSYADLHTRKASWTIDDLSSRTSSMAKGDSIWSPKFNAMGMKDLQLEFFPKGREKTTFEGFCSLFLWCPNGSKIRYQLWVGGFVRAPDEDTYNGRIGHGHSNFCPLQPEVDARSDSITVGVNFIQALSGTTESQSDKGTLRLIPTCLESMVAKEAAVLENRNVAKVSWKITKVSERLRTLPRGASMWSDVFTAGGIREILLEFYPNGSTNTTKEGYCAFYIRCPEGVAMIVTLRVGKVKKGPIKTTFDSMTGKGLPDFCLISEEIENDEIEVGIEVQNQPSKTLSLVTE